MRTDTPISARAAARKTTSSDSAFADEDARLELQSRLIELQEKLQNAETACTEAQKYAEVLQGKLDDCFKEQGLMEETLHERTERVEELEIEKKESLRAKREMEQMYEIERTTVLREREGAEAERQSLVLSMQRLKDSVSSREMRLDGEDRRRSVVSRTSSMRSDPSPNPDGRERGFAPNASLQRSDSRNNSRLVMQKDTVIADLRLELAEAQIRLVELENKDGGMMQQVEKEMYDIKIQNARLMEENESFQLLLSEKTLNGDLSQLELLRPPSHTGSSRPPSAAPCHRVSLADELESYDGTEGDDAESAQRKLQIEINTLKDSNKALTLYINNIVSRLLQHEQFESILDKSPELLAGPGGAASQKPPKVSVEKELPAPPTSSGSEQQTGLLQRAGSVFGRRPRPVSQLPPASSNSLLSEAPRRESLTVNENPDTAPRISFSQTATGRSSAAAAAGHRRSRSDWGAAAAVVGNMYKGPMPGSQAALSPGLTATPTRNPFFTTPSGNFLPTLSDVETSQEKDKENQPHRDSLIPSVSSLATSPEDRTSTRTSSHRNSVISTSHSQPTTDPDGSLSTKAESSNPSSPPQSTHSSSGDRERETRPSGAIMMGSKPRPLRLVQEADEVKKANRASWFGGWKAPAGGFGGYLSGKGAEGSQ